MKGPYQRLKYDLRRVWECPVCAHRERSTGATTTNLCRCQQGTAPTKQVWMRLVEDGPRRATKNGSTAPAPATEPAAEAPQIIQPDDSPPPQP